MKELKLKSVVHILALVLALSLGLTATKSFAFQRPGDKEDNINRFPPADTEVVNTITVATVTFGRFGPISLRLEGDMVIKRGDPFRDRESGLNVVGAEILSLDLRGRAPFGVVNLRGGRNIVTDLPAIVGRFVQTSSNGDFPAISIFEGFVEVEIGKRKKRNPIILRNLKPIRITGPVTDLPLPIGSSFVAGSVVGDQTVTFFDTSTVPPTARGAMYSGFCLTSNPGPQ